MSYLYLVCLQCRSNKFAALLSSPDVSRLFSLAVPMRRPNTFCSAAEKAPSEPHFTCVCVGVPLCVYWVCE